MNLGKLLFHEDGTEKWPLLFFHWDQKGLYLEVINTSAAKTISNGNYILVHKIVLFNTCEETIGVESNHLFKTIGLWQMRSKPINLLNPPSLNLKWVDSLTCSSAFRLAWMQLQVHSTDPSPSLDPPCNGWALELIICKAVIIERRTNI